VYSLVNAPTVAFDLARMPTGASVATVLLEALAIQTAPGTDRPDLSAFDPADATDVRRAAAWLEVSALTGRPSLGDAMSAARQFVDDALNGPDLSTAAGRRALEPLVRDLSTGSFGGLDDVLRLLRLEILDETPTHVVALASDAIAAAYTGRRLADDVRSQLGGPWIAAVRSLPAIPADLGPFAREVRTVLDRVVTLTETEIANQQSLVANHARSLRAIGIPCLPASGDPPRATDLIDAFHAAALQAGGLSDGAPALRPQHGDGYYAAFIRDPDGNRIEAVTFVAVK